jgi:hypothetical protein
VAERACGYASSLERFGSTALACPSAHPGLQIDWAFWSGITRVRNSCQDTANRSSRSAVSLHTSVGLSRTVLLKRQKCTTSPGRYCAVTIRPLVPQSPQRALYREARGGRNGKISKIGPVARQATDHVLRLEFIATEVSPYIVVLRESVAYSHSARQCSKAEFTIAVAVGDTWVRHMYTKARHARRGTSGRTRTCKRPDRPTPRCPDYGQAQCWLRSQSYTGYRADKAGELPTVWSWLTAQPLIFASMASASDTASMPVPRLASRRRRPGAVVRARPRRPGVAFTAGGDVRASGTCGQPAAR